MLNTGPSKSIAKPLFHWVYCVMASSDGDNVGGHNEPNRSTVETSSQDDGGIHNGDANVEESTSKTVGILQEEAETDSPVSDANQSTLTLRRRRLILRALIHLGLWLVMTGYVR